MPLDPVIDYRDGGFEISLAEILYYNRWVNISEAQGNNKFRYWTQIYTVRDGYYNVCDLHKQYFAAAPLQLELTLNAATGLVSVQGIKQPFVVGPLGEALGFRKDLPEVDPQKQKAIIASDLPRLIRYKELFVHLDEGLSTSENKLNGLQSTLLRTISVGGETCNSGVKASETLVKRQWKRLAHGTLSGIKISVRDEHYNMLPFAYLSFVLEVRHKKRRREWGTN